MPVTNTNCQWSYTGDGVTTSFGYDNVIYDAGDLAVYLDGVKRTLTTDYSVTGVGSEDGGSVVFAAAPIAGLEVALVSAIPATQGVAYSPVSATGPAMDRLTRLAQQIGLEAMRALALAAFDPEQGIGPLPALAARQNGGAGSYLGFDGVTGDPTALAGPPADGVAIGAAMIGFVQAASLGAARAILGLGQAAVEGLSNDIIDDGVGNLTIKANGVANAQLAQASALTLKGNAAAGAANVADLTPAQIGPVIRGQVGGFVNQLRNAGCDIAQRGASVTIAAGTPAFALDGYYVSATGANVVASQLASPFAAPLAFSTMKILGQAGVTGCALRLPIESLRAARLAGHTATLQLRVVNQTGVAITPTLTVKHAAAQDNWGAPTTDVNAVALQTIAAGAEGVLSYNFAAAAGAINGLSVTIDFGATLNGAGRYVVIGEGDLRRNDGAAVGQNASPPLPEIRGIASEWPENLRLFAATYDNGTSPGTGTRAGLVGGAVFYSNVASIGIGILLPVPMRAAPTMAWWDGVGNASKASAYQGGAWTDNLAPGSGGGILNIGTRGFMMYALSNGNDSQFIQYTASAEIAGA